MTIKNEIDKIDLFNANKFQLSSAYRVYEILLENPKRSDLYQCIFYQEDRHSPCLKDVKSGYIYPISNESFINIITPMHDCNIVSHRIRTKRILEEIEKSNICINDCDNLVKEFLQKCNCFHTYPLSSKSLSLKRKLNVSQEDIQSTISLLSEQFLEYNKSVSKNISEIKYLNHINKLKDELIKNLEQQIKLQKERIIDLESSKLTDKSSNSLEPNLKKIEDSKAKIAKFISENK